MTSPAPNGASKVPRKSVKLFTLDKTILMDVALWHLMSKVF
jgi:hypothetical protein